MNNLIVPPSPNWYESRILVCTIDNTIIYGARNDIVVIKPKDREEPADIKIITFAHYERVTSIDCNKNWSPTDKWIVSTGEDKIVKLWNMQDFTCKYINNAHTTKADNLIGAVFAGNNKVVSVSENGFITLWHTATDEVVPLKNVFLFKVSITTLSACPHSPWLVAFGSKCGLVIVTDLRKTGKVLFKMRGHDRGIISLSWCPVPFNVLPIKTELLPKPKLTIKNKYPKNGVDYMKLCAALNENLLSTTSSPNDLKENINIDNCTNDQKGSINLNGEAKRNGTSSATDQNFLQKVFEIESIRNIPKELDVGNNLFLERTLSSENKNMSSAAPSEDLVAHLSDEKKISDDDNLQNQNKTEIIKNDSENNEIEVLKEKEDVILQTTSTVIDDEPKQNSKNIYFKEANDKNIEPTKLVNAPSADTKDDLPKREETKEYLLASSSKGGSICIWRAFTDGHKQMEIYLTANRNKKNYRSNDKTWITLCWSDPTKLLSSSAIGELIQWDLLNFNKDKKLPHKKVIHHDHGSNLFAIAVPRTNFNQWDEKESWRNETQSFAWTIGQERFLLCTSLTSERETFASYPTIGGFIYCITSSHLDPTRLAVGIGDNTAKIWDLSRPHTQCVVMTNLWQKIQSKVLSLAWHPRKENILAYSTIEGRIGLINTINTSKLPSLLTQHFRTAVRKIIWGPLNGGDLLALYACGEGKLAIYNSEKPFDEPKIIDIANEYITTISWKIDYTILTVGTKSGAIFVYDQHFTLITVIYTQHKNILNIAWHPEATGEDHEHSPYNSWFAIATSDASIVVYDIDREKSIGNGNEDTDNRIVAVLNGHSKPVRCLSWSYFDNAKLVSGGEDGIAQVWDVLTKNIVSTFTGQNLEAILTILWSPLDANYIISGGKDNCIRIWNILENKPMSDSELAKVRKERFKLKQENKKQKTSDEDVREIKVKRNVMLSVTAKTQNNVQSALEDCKKVFFQSFNADGTNVNEISDSLKDAEKEFDATKICVPDGTNVNGVGDNLKDAGKECDATKIFVPDGTNVNGVSDSLKDAGKECDATKIFAPDGTNVNGVSDSLKDAGKKFDATKIFGDKNDMIELLELEQNQHVERKKYICNQHISLWKGDIAETIKDAIKNGTVTPWLISVAPMVSPKLWSDACESYATKLTENTKSDPIEIVSYLLACHKIQDAIDVLCNATLFREALVLAKCRLLKNDFVIKDIMYKWATFAVTTGLYELAATCYIKLGEYEEAAKALFKRNDPSTLEFAIKLAEKSNNTDLVEAVTLRYNLFKKTEGTNVDIKDEINEIDKLKGIEIKKDESSSEEIAKSTDSDTDDGKERDKKHIIAAIDEFRKINKSKKRCTLNDPNNDDSEDEDDEFIDVEN